VRLVGISEGVGHYTYKNSKNIDDYPRCDNTHKEERGEKGGKTTVGGIEWSAEIPIGSAVPIWIFLSGKKVPVPLQPRTATATAVPVRTILSRQEGPRYD
jgi:hypothetical protein